MNRCWARTCLFAAAVVAVISPGRAERLPVGILTTADGLPRDQLECVRTDRRGFIWFCTAEGLVRYDGQVAVTFGRADGLDPPRVRSFLNTRDNHYFVGVDGGLFTFDDRTTDDSRRFAPLRRADGKRLVGVNALVEARDRSIWCGTGDGLLHLVERDGQFRLVEVDIGLPRQVENDRIVRTVLEDERGVLWIGAGSGLFVRDADGKVTHLTAANGLPANDVLHVAQDAEGRIWVMTRQGAALLDRAALARGDRRVIRRVFTEADGLPSRNVRSLQVDGTTLWFATILGVVEATLSPQADVRIDRRLTGFFAWDMTIDRRGDIWIATESGARRLPRQGFSTYSTEDGLTFSRVAALAQSAAGPICATIVGTPIELNCFEAGRFRRIVVNATRGVRDSGWGWWQLTLQDRLGGWWVPTGDGLFRFAPGPASSLATARPIAVYTRQQGLRTDNVFRVFEDSSGGIWASTFAEDGSGLVRIDRSTGRLQRFGPADGYGDDLPTPHALAEDSSGTIWIGYGEGRLLRYGGSRFEEIPLQRLAPGERPPTYEVVESIVADARGRIWIASTSQGLGRIDEPTAPTPTIKWYGRAAGLSSESASVIAADASGDLFVGTGRGIDRFDPATERFTHFSAAEGVPRGEILGALRDRDGRIWFSTTAGVARFDGRRADPPQRPATFITAIRVAGVPLRFRVAGATSVEPFTVQPGDRRVEIDFVSPGLRPADGLRYQYRLEGIDADWTTTDARTVALAGASPGRYQFVVRAVLGRDFVSDPAVVEFVVLAPVWRRGWFVALLGVGGAGLVYSLHRARIRRAILVERVRSQIAADLHDNVGARLSRIAILSEVVRQQAQSALPGALSSLSAIAENARAVIDDMSDAVWFIDPRLDTLQHVIARTWTLGSELFGGGRIGLRIEGPADAAQVTLTSTQRRHLYLMLKELLTNVMRHAGATEVVVRIDVAGERVRVEVTDNGVGWREGEAERHLPRQGRGIESLRQRAAALGGTARFDRGPGDRGTRVTIDVPATAPA